MENLHYNSNVNREIFDKLTVDEKIRLFNGDGSWYSCTLNKTIPYFVMSDGPHGLRKQEEENYSDLNKSKIATCFPTASCIASSWNRNSMKILGDTLAKEALHEKVNMVLGPGINIKRSPLCGRNFEYFSEDPYLAGTLAANYINAMQDNGVAACLKHFACNNQETRRQTSNSIIDERTLREIYLRAFEIVVKESNPIGIMGSYNRLNGEYTCASKKLLTDILRNEWGFNGIVISDWGACIDSAKCAKAGMNLAMPDSEGYLPKTLKKALADGVISMSQIEDVVYPVLETAASFPKNKDPAVNYEEHHLLAKELAEDSAVLLKNDGILPLKPGKVAVIGELAEFMKFQGGGSSHITTREYPNALESLKNLGFEVLYSKGYYSGFCKEKDIVKKNAPLQKEAVSFITKIAAENIPVLFFTGLTECYEGEGFDRTTLELPQEQLKLLNDILNITANVAVINFSGAPVDFSPVKNAKALLQMYLPGEAAGEAVADLISGKVNPSGKLAETYPCKLSDVPCYENFGKNEDNVPYRETVFVGYRYFESRNIPVQYEFGFGLSYTTFEYSELQVIKESDERVTVKLSVENTGNVDGSEIVQIYVSPVQTDEEKLLRPAMELRGFTKVFLKAGEKQRVEIPLDVNAFKVFSEKDNSFVTSGGKYAIKAGASVRDIRLETEIDVEGEKFCALAAPVPESFYIENSIQAHKKGSFTMSDSLIDMANESNFIKHALRIIKFAIILMNKGKSKEDPAVKIALSAVAENPLESLISTSGGAISEKTARWFLKHANK